MSPNYRHLKLMSSNLFICLQDVIKIAAVCAVTQAALLAAFVGVCWAFIRCRKWMARPRPRPQRLADGVNLEMTPNIGASPVLPPPTYANLSRLERMASISSPYGSRTYLFFLFLIKLEWKDGQKKKMCLLIAHITFELPVG